MAGVDALTRQFGPLIATHCSISNILFQQDRHHRPLAYIASIFNTSATAISNDKDTTTSKELILTTPFTTQLTKSLNNVNGDADNDGGVNVHVGASVGAGVGVGISVGIDVG